MVTDRAIRRVSRRVPFPTRGPVQSACLPAEYSRSASWVALPPKVNWYSALPQAIGAGADEALETWLALGGARCNGVHDRLDMKAFQHRLDAYHFLAPIET